jgi:hypothetical protein
MLIELALTHPCAETIYWTAAATTAAGAGQTAAVAPPIHELFVATHGPEAAQRTQDGAVPLAGSRS